MTGSGGSYVFKISDIKAFYELTDQELEGLTKIGVIAKTKAGKQTEDLFLEVVQGRQNAYSGGEGTAESPFIIKTKADLQALAETPMDWAADTYLVLDQDIDASGASITIGSIASPFKASLDGKGHTIKNITVTNTTIGAATGLFGAIDGGTVKNLGITGASISGTTYSGILAGILKSGRISSCFTAGEVKGSSICTGGLVGENLAGTISDCYSGATVSNPTDYAIGGLVGKNCGTVMNTYAAGAVTGFDYTGGVVGANYGVIKGSVALNAKLTSHNDYAAWFGGNNNSENNTDRNYSWKDMPKGHNEWAEHGDYATAKPASDLAKEAIFRELTGWDFTNTWEWKGDGKKQYPILRGIANQPCLISDTYFDMSVSLLETVSSDKSIKAGPNPVETILYVTSGTPIASYDICALNGSTVSSGAGQEAYSLEIDMTGKASGLYILRVSTIEGAIYTKKIIKK